MDNAELYLSLVSAAGLILVAASAVLIWRQKNSLSYGWFLLGGALWCAALPITFGIAMSAGRVVRTTHRRPWTVAGGFAIFALLDGIATAAMVRGGVDTAFIWLVESAYLPLALVNIRILGWCQSQFCFSGKGGVGEPQVVAAQ